MSSASASIPILTFSTAHLPPEERYAAWRERDWPRLDPIFRTEPYEPFDTYWETAPLDRLMFVYTRITGMHWERRAQDIRNSDFQPIIVTMMLEGTAQGDLDGRVFHEPPGTYHFHDLARPSLHVSTASLCYSLIIPREVAKAWFTPIEDLHGLVVGEDMAGAMIGLAETFHRLLPSMDASRAARFERAMLELLVAGVEATRPTAPARATPDDVLRARAVAAINERLGLEGASAAELGRMLGVSARRLGAAFRADGGIQAYLLQRRLEATRMALTGPEPAEPIGNIAHRLGFSDAAHLSRAFKQRYGLTPRAYRSLGAGAKPGETQTPFRRTA